MGTLLQDLRYGLRMLAKSPGFTAIAVLTLALGIGANTAIFSFVNGTLLRSFPYRDANRLVLLWSSNSTHHWSRNIVYPADFVDWQAESRSFAGLAAFDDWGVNLAEDGTPMMVPALRVTANLFSVLGVAPELGRGFQPDEDRPGAPRVVVISHSLWTQHFAGDRAVVGKTVRLNGENFNIVGVMPASFEFPPDYFNNIQLWTPLQFDHARVDRDFHNFYVLGRLKPGTSLGQAQIEMDTIARRIEQAYPATEAGWGVSIETLRDSVTGDVRPILIVLMAAVGCVLLIACGNVANLQLARAVARQKEIAIRAALGAGRARLVRQFLVESALLAVAGGALGVLVASWGVGLVLKLYLAKSPGFEAVTIDNRVLLFTLMLSLATAFVFGLVPALLASRSDLIETLKEGGRSSGQASGSQRLRSILVTAEFALALVLLVGAGLLVRTFVALTHVNPGFDARNVLTFHIPFSGPRYSQQSARAAFYDQLIPKIKSLPGVESASVITSLPLVGVNGMGFVTEENPSPAPNNSPDASYQVIAPDYFRAMRIPQIEGRHFNNEDQHDTQPAVIINEALSRTYWPGEHALGKHLKLWGKSNDKNPWLTVVGVVGNVHRLGLDQSPYPELFVPYTQYPWLNNPQAFIVRTVSDPRQMTSAIRRAVSEIDADQPISEVTTMQEVLEGSLSDRSFNMTLLAALAALALMLAAVGIYASMSYAVSQRFHEIGIRMALGAERRDVLKLVLGRGFMLSVAGVGIGLAGALVLMRLMSSLLYGVRPFDPLTFTVVSIGLVAIALLASYVPARRATRVDPMVALRYE